MAKPLLAIQGQIKPNQEITFKIFNPFKTDGILFTEVDGQNISTKIPPVEYHELKMVVPDLPGKMFICNFFTRVNGVIEFSNTLPVQIPLETEFHGFSVNITAKPMMAADDKSGWHKNSIVTLPILLSEKDDIKVDINGLCNLKAELISNTNIKILAQQFNCLSVFHRGDKTKQRARVVHGYILLSETAGHTNESYEFVIKTTNGFLGSASLITSQHNDVVTVDTGASKVKLVTNSTNGFAINSIEVAKQNVLDINGGHIYMLRRHFDGTPGVDYLSSLNGNAKITVVKNGQAYTELLISGTLLPQNNLWAIPQQYNLLLKMHAGSTEIDGELMLTNISASIDGIPSNYIIPYDGFGIKLNFVKDLDNTIKQNILMTGSNMASYTLDTNDQISVLCGYKAPRWNAEYEGLQDWHYWTENQRVEGGTTLDFVTKGFSIYKNGTIDGGQSNFFNNPAMYPAGCVSHLQVDNSNFAFQVGTYPEYEQPIGITVENVGRIAAVNLCLTDKLAPNKLGKSIPWRTSIRKSFYIDLDYFESQGLLNFVLARQTPYFGIYNKITNYNNRGFNFNWLEANERNALLQKIGFLKPGDGHQLINPLRKNIGKPFFVGSNRTGGTMNWDTAYNFYTMALNGLPGSLMALRLQLTFHSILGHKQFEDNQISKGVLNPNQPVSTIWAIDIEHEDHKGYHVGVLLFGNPLDVVALSRMAYETLAARVGNTLWIRAVGNQIGRLIEEQSTLRGLIWPQKILNSSNIEDDILPNTLNYIEDFFNRRIDENDPFNSSGWMSEPGLLPAFTQDPEEADWPVAHLGLPKRYLTVKKAARVKMIDEFHLSKGLAAFREFLLTIQDFPTAYQNRVINILKIANLRQAQRAMTFAQYYTFLAFCNFTPACTQYKRMTPWERVVRQKKYYPSDMTICDPRFRDEENTWGGYDYMDCYADAAAQYLNAGDNKSAFYILRAALNHMAMNRWNKPPGNPCDAPPDGKQNDFFGGIHYSSYNRVLRMIRDRGFLDKFTHQYPMLFPTEVKWEVA